MTDLARTFDTLWAMLETGTTDRDAPARHPVLATAGPNGAEARILVLRRADREGGTVSLYTDAATAKITDLAHEPRATLLVWDPAARLQIRLRVHVDARPGTAEEWEALSGAARAAYGGDPPPGHPIPSPDRHAPDADATRFTVLEARIAEIETLRLADPHERARFSRADGFAGAWIAP